MRPALAILPGLLLWLRVSAALSLTDSPTPADFILFDGKNAAAIFVETNDDRAVLRAAGDLAEDVARVTGVRPALTRHPGDEKILIIAGTLGRSKTVDQLAKQGMLDVGGVRGEWESYVLQVVTNPLPHVDAALVIAGSDRRGTIYGIYQLSEWIGVSPWYWWADVPPKPNKLLTLRGDIFKQGPPAVKYRGIFLNDEDWGLRPWAAKTFEPEAGNIGPRTYAKVFELLLRLRANYLWPAMHEGTPAFNSFPTNKEIADTYGIVMGSAHCEQMLRNNVDEWKTNEFGRYNYVVNRDGVLRYWEQRVRENGRFENVYTMGMRGIHDSGMPGGGTPHEQAERLHRIIDDQRALLARSVSTNLAVVPQIFCPYKEVLGLYRLAPDIPGDITLVWPDDNFGYVRAFSDASERRRRGGAGVYYHVSYWGRPQDYLWLCSTPPALIGEEMSKAFDYGADRLWVLNVGDLKPAELLIEFFLDLAWNPRVWNATNTYALLERQLTRDFGPAQGREISAILAEYYRLNFPRKPEHLGVGTNGLFSTTANGDETEQRLAAWRALVARTDAMQKQLPTERQDAFFETVGYSVRTAALMNEKWLTLTTFYAHSKQGRADAYDLLQQAQRAQDEIQRLTDVYNNQTAGGKWRHMMSSHPRNLAVFGMPKIPAANIPDSPPRLGLALEGNDQPFFANQQNTNSPDCLPQFNRLTRRAYFVDIFNAGTHPLHWTATPDANWIQLSRESGEADTRVRVNIDWSRVPAGEDVRSAIRFNAADQGISVQVGVFNPADTNLADGADFVEDDHRVVMEAEHASAFVPGQDAKWEVIRGLGYNGEAVSVFPRLVSVRSEPRTILSESPCLQYRVWVRHPGDWQVVVRALPTFSVETGQPQRYAVALDNEPPNVVLFPAALSEADRRWQENVLRNAALTASVHAIAQAGRHTLKVWMVDPGIVLDTIEMESDGAPAPGYTWPPETKAETHPVLE